jgi:dephospho-CoA kinase
MRQTGILLTGGIGSGKSTAAGMLASLGASVISSDAAAHRVLEPGGAAAGAVARRFPEAVDGGRIDRERLGRIVFDDRRALADLEALTHPSIGELLAAEVASADAPLIVLEIPLLRDPLGSGWPVVVVDAPVEVRIERLAARGMPRDEARRRMDAQPDRERWLAAADHVIDNGGGLEDLAAACRALWRELLGA